MLCLYVSFFKHLFKFTFKYYIKFYIRVELSKFLSKLYTYNCLNLFTVVVKFGHIFVPYSSVTSDISTSLVFFIGLNKESLRGIGSLGLKLYKSKKFASKLQ